MTALRVLDAVQTIVTGRIYKYNNKAEKAFRTGKDFHPEGEMMLERAKYLADELEASREAVARLVQAARVFDDLHRTATDGVLGIGLTNGDFFRLRDALEAFEVQP